MLSDAARGVAVACALALAACGFRPLYAPPPDGADVGDELAAIEVAPLGGRLGQILRNALVDELRSAGAPPNRYVLDVQVARSSNALAVQLDNTITRFNLRLAASFSLRPADAPQPLFRSFVAREAAYNVRREPFATLVSERDAERRAALAVSEDIRLQLAAFFARSAA